MTRERITTAYETAGYSIEEREKDPRYRILIEAADAFEQYQWNLGSLVDLADDLQRRDREHGIGAVWDTVLEHSCITDIKRAAHRINALRDVLMHLPKGRDDAVTALVRASVARNQISTVERG